jgi:gluconate 2-dehydrogenase gamma chain
MLKGKHNSRPADSGLTRQEFLRQTGAVTLLAGLLASKPVVALALGDETLARQTNTEFGESQKRVLNAVQMQLFPADGNGPSAEDLHALEYLLWALEDPENIEDGDKEFIVKGISWLEEASRSRYGNSFVQLSSVQQDTILHQIAESSAGENWLSLLLYYLFESLTLDPVYGGNPDGIGWHWLEHQPGFPRPTKETSYRHFV